MKPKPFSELNHFTKPVILLDIDTSLNFFEPHVVANMACLQMMTYGALRRRLMQRSIEG